MVGFRRYNGPSIDMASTYLLGFLIISSTLLSEAVDRNNFKKCDQSSFCQRCRKMEAGKTPYELLPETTTSNDTTLSSELFNNDTGVVYTLHLVALKNYNFRLKINEKSPPRPRYEVQYVLSDEIELGKLSVVESTTSQVVVANGPNKAVLKVRPFQVEMYSGDKLVIVANARGLMRLEHLRNKPQPQPEQPPEEAENAEPPQFPGDGADTFDGAWEENFKGHHDSKPSGPEAVAMDFSFPEAEHVYGIPEHADSFALKSTKSTEPYRLYNLDVFEYELKETMALYGAVPVLYAHGKERTSGVFWLNAAETWVDISSTDNGRLSGFVNRIFDTAQKQEAHFMSESGIIDTFFLLGPKPLDAFSQYTALTGTAPLPPIFSLGYHQSRWNYNSQSDVEQINENFDKYDMPMDVVWLDIEYTDEKKYFTWNPKEFSDPLEMVHNLTEKGRKLVVIIDPHIKRDPNYFLHNDATSMGLYVKNKEGRDYEGHCWPGASSYLDFFDPKVRDYVMDLYNFEKFNGTTKDVHIWNDMNEPSVFNGPEITMPKDLKHYGGWDHRDVHNIYGFMNTMTTYQALIKRSNGLLRPFILSRSHFAGSQRHAAVWTGDNMAEWEHLQISYPMCLSLAISGISFCGADVGGFFKNPNSELFLRWNQAGIWLPFFRQHSHIDTKRREPWTFNDDVTQFVRDTLRVRYTYLPMWYTLFREHEIEGTPVLLPLWAQFPTESETFAIDDQLLVGGAILVRPIYEPSASKVQVYLPGKGSVSWYDIDTLQKHPDHEYVQIDAVQYKIPVFQRDGTIIPRKMRFRRSTKAMKNDPYTLIVIANSNQQANGTLYIDDETTFDYRNGKYLYLRLQFDGTNLTSKYINPDAKYDTKSWLERVDVANPPMGVTSANLISSGQKTKTQLETTYNSYNVLTIRKPSIKMSEEWTIELVK